ncbi:hypothetical protein [Nocardia nepalensis]|uniref:hypothetical protein n=1 Tax=Nocardia nepalensis TaxID=3375448 RepID=UPI003B67B65C
MTILEGGRFDRADDGGIRQATHQTARRLNPLPAPVCGPGTQRPRPPPGKPFARKHTHSFEEVISHVAKMYAEASWTVLHHYDAQLRHEALFHLGQMLSCNRDSHCPVRRKYR